MKFQLSDIETRGEKMRETLHYRQLKQAIYNHLKTLRTQLVENQSYLSDISSKETNSVEQFDGLISECGSKQTEFESQSSKIDELRRLASEATLLPGAFSDPSNSIKSDLNKFCESWQELESKFTDALQRLRRDKKEFFDKKSVDIFVEDVHEMEDHFYRIRNDDRIDVNLVAEFESLLSNVKRFNEEVEGLNVW